MALTEQDYIDIEESIDELDFEQLAEIGERLQTESPGTIVRWLLRKLREYAYPS